MQPVGSQSLSCTISPLNYVVSRGIWRARWGWRKREGGEQNGAQHLLAKQGRDTKARIGWALTLTNCHLSQLEYPCFGHAALYAALLRTTAVATLQVSMLGGVREDWVPLPDPLAAATGQPLCAVDNFQVLFKFL